MLNGHKINLLLLPVLHYIVIRHMAAVVIATLVRCALAEVCTVPMPLVYFVLFLGRITTNPYIDAAYCY